MRPGAHAQWLPPPPRGLASKRPAPSAGVILLAWGMALALLVQAWHLKHPLLFWLRDWETPLLLSAGLGGAAAGFLRGGGAPRLLGLAFLAVAGLTAYRELEFAATRAAVLAAGPAQRAVGGHFLVGFRDFAELESLAEKGLVGGLYVTRHNLRRTPPAQLAAEIASLQERRREAGLPPLVVAADQEGGEVSHLSPWLTPRPALASLAVTRRGLTPEDQARAYGRAQGRELARLGINLNFGPVVDLKPERGFAADRRTLIARRAIAADPDLVARIAGNYAAGLAEAGVGATYKHFPGLHRLRADTHFRPARLDLPPQALGDDWRPYEAAPAGAAVMVGHVTLAAVDGDRAASHSPAVIAGLLRGHLGHGGLVVTDDLNMGAVYDRGIGRVAGEALAAGADLVLVSYDPDQIYRAIQGAARALEAGAIDPDALAASRERLGDFFERRAAAAGAAPRGAGIW